LPLTRAYASDDAMTQAVPQSISARRPTRASPIRPIPTLHRVQIPRPRALRQNPAAWIGIGLMLAIIGLSLAAPGLAPYDPIATAPAGQLQPPSLSHPAGTDLFGRDVWSRVLWGGRLSLGAGMLAVVLAVLPGGLLGLLSGYVGGWLDSFLMRIVDVLLSFPSLLLALTIVALLGPGLASVILAVGLAGIPRFARLVRAGTLGVRSELFIEAARVVGCRPGRILLRHVAPNVQGIIIPLSALELGYALLNISALSFLGLGVQPPTPEWGAMLAEGRVLLRHAPWVVTAPGLAITLSVLAFNLVGDALRDALDAQTGS
jgi:ABC-type dipeptide/oligopeptide/nickel transport system permease subunit